MGGRKARGKEIEGVVPHITPPTHTTPPANTTPLYIYVCIWMTVGDLIYKYVWTSQNVVLCSVNTSGERIVDSKYMYVILSRHDDCHSLISSTGLKTQELL